MLEGELRDDFGDFEVALLVAVFCIHRNVDDDRANDVETKQHVRLEKISLADRSKGKELDNVRMNGGKRDYGFYLWDDLGLWTRMTKFLAVYDRMFQGSSFWIGSKSYTILVIAAADEAFWRRLAAPSTRKSEGSLKVSIRSTGRRGISLWFI